MSKKKKKKNKQKVIYYDDNSVLSDMSQLPQKQKRQPQNKAPSTFHDKWKTYWSTVRKMLIPLFLALLALAALYLIIRLTTL